jgi:hypothetical protein
MYLLEFNLSGWIEANTHSHTEFKCPWKTERANKKDVWNVETNPEMFIYLPLWFQFPCASTRTHSPPLTKS